MAWQPISTAPRDGTVIDLWCTGEPDDIAFYCRDLFGKRQGRVTECYFDRGWRPCMGLTRGALLPVEPTHWRPLPNPPEEIEP
jgi:hypothetical protein